MSNHVAALASIVTLVADIQDIGTRKHLRAAFICLSNSVVRETFDGLQPKESLVRDGNHLSPATFNGITLNDDEFIDIRCGNKLNAIKSYKSRTGKSLMESKRDIENWGYEGGYYNTPSSHI